jgi:hypothetical protein
MAPNPQNKKAVLAALAGAKEQLAECKDEAAALKADLAECRDAVELDHSLLKSGLRLAMENEALRKQGGGLLDDHGKAAHPDVTEEIAMEPPDSAGS